MALASGPASFQRFYIQGALPHDVDEAMINGLNARAFGKLPTLADDTQIGWIGPTHLFESEIRAEAISFGRFALFAMRVDTLRVPPAVLKSYVRMEQQVALQTSGRDFLSKGEKRQARARAGERAEREVRSGAFRRITSQPVLLDLEQKTAYLGGLGSTSGDRFMQLFADSLPASLEPADVERSMTRLMSSPRHSRAMENLAPRWFTPPPEGVEPEGVSVDMAFLGREFLTWLWHAVEQQGPLRVRSGDDVTVMIDRTIRLECPHGITGTDVITADGPTALPEAKAALRAGKLPTKAGLLIGCGASEYRLTLDAGRMAVSGLALPEESADDARGRLEQRFERIAEVAALLDGLYELFLLCRLGDAWDATAREISAWIGGGARQRSLHTVPA